MNLISTSAWIMTFFAGLWCGGIVVFAVERTNLWRRMPLEQYAVDFRRSVLRVDPMMPILGIVSGIAAVVFALNSAGAGRQLAFAGMGLMILVILGSILIAEPMNSKFRRLPEGELPADIASIRDKWRSFHSARTVVALATFACMVGAAVA